MMLDVDFWLCTDFRTRMLESPEIMARLKSGMAAFVVPAFEFHKQSDGVDPTSFPSVKEVRPFSSPSSETTLTMKGRTGPRPARQG